MTRRLPSRSSTTITLGVLATKELGSCSLFIRCARKVSWIKDSIFEMIPPKCILSVDDRGYMGCLAPQSSCGVVSVWASAFL